MSFLQVLSQVLLLGLMQVLMQLVTLGLIIGAGILICYLGMRLMPSFEMTERRETSPKP